MNSKYYQLALGFFVVLEIFLMVNIYLIADFLIQQLFIGLFIFFLVLIIRLISNKK
ncbi:hypothetical protein [Flavobacterium oreochromis]|uniref:Uncharacterized protein n=1 Tax=Flavobacterium oreochromis TaxID=2906078 RepID=A0ABW8P7A0_9FLAO|nr:hypothetical protein [Flavobacterium oreochromis]QYS85684.1 hypothetical protein JJC03_10895 [Flavobacterium oreochromis]